MPTTPRSVNWFAVQGVQNPSSTEFLEHPDYRQIAAFFLGWVFFYSAHSILRSPLLAGLTARLGDILCVRDPLPDPEGQSRIEKAGRSWDVSNAPIAAPASLRIRGDNPTLGFTLFLCFFLASVALFISLLSFDPSGGGVGCAFFSAWGFMAAKSVLLIGLLILSLELRQLGISRTEAFVVWGFLGVALVLVFVTAAIATGFLSVIKPIGFALCSRKYFLPTSIIASLIYFFLELYAVCRLYMRIGTLRDIRVLRALSLVLLTLLTMVPDAIPANTLAQFIPLTVASCVVLAAFNYPRSLPSPTIGLPASNDTLASVQGVYGSRNSASVSVQPTMSPPEAHAVQQAPPLSPPDVSVVPPLERASQRSIPPPLRMEALQQPSYVAGPLRDEYKAFQSPMAKSPMPQTARSNWTVDTPMLGAFQSPGLQLTSAQQASLVEHHTPAMMRAARVLSSVPVVGEGPWRQSHAAFAAPQRIVPSQAELAEELEAADRKRATPTGPTVRPPRPRVTIGSPGVLAPVAERQLSTGPRSADSAYYGSDIIRPTPSKRRKDKTLRHASWAASVATMGIPESAVSPERTVSRRSIVSTLASAIRPGHRANRSVDTIPALPSPPFADAMNERTVLEDPERPRAPSRTGTLPPEIALMAVQPLRIAPKATTGIRGPRPLPPISPPMWGRTQGRTGMGGMYTQDGLSESPEGSPVRETWQDGLR